MAFYASNFIYDGKPGSEYGLRISSLSEQGESAGASVELITQDIYRRPNVYLLGVKQTPTLSIPISVTVKKELTANQSSEISKWLFGHQTYKKLQIIQPDMEYVYYNCIFQNPSVIKNREHHKGIYSHGSMRLSFCVAIPKKRNVYF